MEATIELCKNGSLKDSKNDTINMDLSSAKKRPLDELQLNKV